MKNDAERYAFWRDRGLLQPLIEEYLAAKSGASDSVAIGPLTAKEVDDHVDEMFNCGARLNEDGQMIFQVTVDDVRKALASQGLSDELDTETLAEVEAEIAKGRTVSQVVDAIRHRQHGKNLGSKLGQRIEGIRDRAAIDKHDDDGPP